MLIHFYSYNVLHNKIHETINKNKKIKNLQINQLACFTTLTYEKVNNNRNY